MNKIIAEKIWVRENTWNGKVIKSYTAGFQQKYYNLKGHQASKVVEGQPLMGVISEFKYESKKTGNQETGYDFFIYNPIELDFAKRIEVLEKQFKGEHVADLEETDEDEVDVEDIPF